MLPFATVMVEMPAIISPQPAFDDLAAVPDDEGDRPSKERKEEGFGLEPAP